MNPPKSKCKRIVSGPSMFLGQSKITIYGSKILFISDFKNIFVVIFRIGDCKKNAYNKRNCNRHRLDIYKVKVNLNKDSLFYVLHAY